MARDDVRRGVRLFRATLRAVLRRPWQVLGIWTPLALAMAIGWPAALFSSDPGLQRLAIVAGLTVIQFRHIERKVHY